MKLVVPPVNPESPRDAITNLQDALVALLRAVAIQVGDDERQAFEDRLSTTERATYGSATRKAVAIFQGQRALADSGMVDEATARAINDTLRERGLLDPGGVPAARLVSGRVVREDGPAVAGLRVRAVHDGPSAEVRLGEDTTDAAGRYTIRYDSLPDQGTIVLRVTAFGADGTLLGSSDRVREPRAVETVDLRVPFALPADARRRLEGRVVLEHGAVAAPMTLRLYRREFGGGATRIAETTTREGGLYSVEYDGDLPGGIELRAVHGEEEVPLSRTMHDLDAQARAVLNVAAPSRLQPLDAEFRRMAADLTPHLADVGTLSEAREDGDQQDLTLLNRATGWDARLLALASQAATLSKDDSIGLSHEVLYGLMRAGLPSDKLQLARVSSEAVGLALGKARDAGIIQGSDEELDATRTRFAAFAREASLSVQAPGSRSSYRDLLDAANLDAAARDQFADVYLGHRGDAASLWDRASRAGLSSVQIRALQRVGKFAFLTGNSAGLTNRLQTVLGVSEPAALVDKDFDQPETWKNEARQLAGNAPERLAALIPPAYEGDDVDARLDAYAEDMARKVRVSYPTHVVRRMIERDADDTQFQLGAAKAATTAVLGAAADKGFRFGSTPATTFIARNPDVLAGIPADATRAASEGVRTLQRLYQITPASDAMPVLLKLGFTSAHDVVSMSQDAFLERYASHFASEEVTRLVYRKAQQVAAVTYNVFTIARKFETEAPLPALSSPAVVREAARNELIKHFPTMESLFGSMDYCECEHCRSVLSPAAYLVDLLQFIDVEKPLWRNFLDTWRVRHGNEDYLATYKKPYDALVERRPDLPSIPLTCENTNTALPYIDVVNEILEYYIAHGKLEAAAARDTGSATTAELLAEPQHLESAAYEALQQARYPIGLPFDLWLETVRRFCDACDTPLWQLLETFRSSDDLFAPTQLYDRAAIFVESLGVSPAEATLLTDSKALDTWFELYGFATEEEALTVAVDADTKQRVDLNSAKALSRRLGVTYKELVDLVQSGFVNPRLAGLVALYKLGVSVGDVRHYAANKAFHDANKDLIGADRDALAAVDQARFDALVNTDWDRLREVEGFERRLDDLTARYEAFGFDARAWIASALTANAFDEVLLLADDEAGGDFDHTTVRYASGRAIDRSALLRINLFVRLWRKLGWTIEETDRALQALVPANVPLDEAHAAQSPLRSALVHLAHLSALAARIGTGRDARLRLVTLWSDVPTTGRDSLYARLFLRRTILANDPVFDDPLGRYLSVESVAAATSARRHDVLRADVPPADAITPGDLAADPRVTVAYDPIARVQRLSYQGVLTNAQKAILAGLSASPALPPLLDAVQVRAADYGRISGHVLALQAALGLTADEIDRILEDAGKAPRTAELSLGNVSVLHRYGVLARSLRISVRDLIALKTLTGVDPFRPVHPDALTTLADDHPFTGTLRFVEIVEAITGSGLTVEDLQFLVRHEIDQTSRHRSDPITTLALLRTIADGVRAIRMEHAVPSAAVQLDEDALRQKLGLALAPAVVERFVGMINGSAEFTATASGVLPADRLNPADFHDLAIRDLAYNEPRAEQRLTFRGVLFDAERTRLDAALPPAPAGGAHVSSRLFGRLLADVQAQARRFFDDNLKVQKLRVEDETGFLVEADFDPLFGPLTPSIPILPSDTEAQVATKTRQNEQILDANAAALQARYHRVAEAFLPMLQRRLVRIFVVQTLATQSGADPQLVAGLVTDERLLTTNAGAVAPLVQAFAAAGRYGLTAHFYAATDASGAELPASDFADADTGLRDQGGRSLKPAGANSARFEGYVEVAAPGAYRFYVTLDKAGAAVALRIGDDTAPLRLDATAGADGDEPSAFLELRPGVPYRFSIALTNLQGGDGRVLVQGETLAKGPLGRLALRPLAAMDDAERAWVLLRKSLLIVQALGLSEREARHLLTHPDDFSGLSFSALPTTAVKDASAAPPLMAQLLRVIQYACVRQDMAGGSDELIGVFTAETPEKAQAVVAKLTRRTPRVVGEAANAVLPGKALHDERALQRLWDALQLIERFGVPTSSLVAWTGIVNATTTPATRAAIARDIRAAIKARFDPDAWQRIGQGIFDPLRRRQRDALVAHVTHQRGFASTEQLYEYFLVDPGMEPVVQTSRIRLAIASVQLFVQRCLLNLERFVHPSAVNARQWEWMKRYRVWEANRKIFLFPENWLEPEFRDDKSHLFRELEGALLQGDVSADLVEDAFLTYLRKLDELAGLEIVAMHVEDQADPSLNTLHVIGRSHGRQNQHFYRRFAHQVWTPWEPVSADISGDHLAPVVWRNRLYVFWVTFVDRMEHQDPPAPPKSKSATSGAVVDISTVMLTGSDTTGLGEMTPATLSRHVRSAADDKIVQVQLHWSEYLQGEWSTPESSAFGQAITVRVPPSFNPATVPVHVTRTFEDGEERGVSVHLGGAINASFYVAGRNSKPVVRPYGARPRNPYSASGVLPTQYAGSGPLTVTFHQRITTEDGKPPVDTAVTPAILQQGGAYTLLACNNEITLGDAEIASLVKPVFYQAGEHTFYIEPDLTERTIDDWQEFVTRTPQPESEWDRPDWWKEIHLAPAVPWKKGLLASPDDRSPSAGIGQESILGVKPQRDWVVNPSTAVLFGGAVIGPAGRADLNVLATRDADGIVASGGRAMPLTAGSSVAADHAVVAAGRDELVRAGLTPEGGSSLNVVGGSGFNAALARGVEARLRGPAATSGRMNG